MVPHNLHHFLQNDPNKHIYGSRVLAFRRCFRPSPVHPGADAAGGSLTQKFCSGGWGRWETTCRPLEPKWVLQGAGIKGLGRGNGNFLSGVGFWADQPNGTKSWD